MIVRFCAATAALALSCAILTGCGTPASPQPPSLKLPTPVTDLSALRTGNDVHLQWTMPKRTTDKVLLSGDQKAHICRRIDTGPCDTAGDMLFPPGKPAQFTDHLPAALTTGSPRVLTYTVELRNHSDHTAGPSNSAPTAAGAAPARIEYFTATVHPDGVVLHWMPIAGDTIVRLHRELVAKPGAPKPSERSGTIAPPQQTLEISGPDKGIALDRDAALDNTYRYTAERVLKVALAQPSVEVLSLPSETITIDAHDIFPPHVPGDLSIVPDPEAHAIDLSWSPVPDADVAAYVIYRRDSGSSAAPIRVSTPGQPVAPAFHDAAVQPGHSYLYSVSALDHDGNESPRSPEVEVTLPQP